MRNTAAAAGSISQNLAEWKDDLASPISSPPMPAKSPHTSPLITLAAWLGNMRSPIQRWDKRTYIRLTFTAATSSYIASMRFGSAGLGTPFPIARMEGIQTVLYRQVWL